MNILVCGSRWYGRLRAAYISEKEYNDDLELRVIPQQALLESTLIEFISNHYLQNPDDPVTIISGMAPGADTLAANFAIENNINLKPFPADWDRYKKGAGPIRNQEMIDMGKPNICIAFLMPNSKGTKDMVNRCRMEGIEVVEIND